MRFSRVRTLLGEESFETLSAKKVLLLGVGGVGSFCLDCLYRSGVRDITIIDYDRFDITNQNRQMHSELHEGELKVEALKSHYEGITALDIKLTPEWIDGYDFSPYDIIIDAIDDTRAKVALIKKCHKKLISAVGSAKRLDATKIEVRPFWKITGDRFAAKLRSILRKEGFKGDFLCVCSTEEPRCSEKGSFVGVTGSFGLMLCSLAVKKLLDIK